MSTPIIQRLRADYANRQIWLWGAGNQGRGIADVLAKLQIPVAGFIDSSHVLHGTRVAGLPVLAPEQALLPENAARSTVIASSFFFEDQIRSQALQLGLTEQSFISYRSIKPFDFSVEIAAGCNLKCPSCPRSTPGGPGGQECRMSLETFTNVLDKILAENPFLGNIQLYQWSEPVLNPQLPQMIRLAASHGVRCAVSSNLNLQIDYTDIIAAQPSWFRVSCSGIGPNYEKTHAAASWNTFRSNLGKLAELRSKLHPEMKFELFFHIYKHSLQDLPAVQAICQELNIEFHPVHAYIISLDDVLARMEGTPLPPQMLALENNLTLPLDQGLALAKSQTSSECPSLRCILVNSDLSVANCMMYYYRKDNIATENFLETPLQDIQRRRLACSLCNRCRKHSMHRYCHIYSTLPPPAQ